MIKRSSSSPSITGNDDDGDAFRRNFEWLYLQSSKQFALHQPARVAQWFRAFRSYLLAIDEKVACSIQVSGISAFAYPGLKVGKRSMMVYPEIAHESSCSSF